MRYLLVTILLQFQLFAQENSDTLRIEEPVLIGCYMGPEFPGGSQALKDYFAKNIIIPSVSDRLFPVKCYTKFVVSSNGKISNVEVLKSVPFCIECEQEAARLIQNMPDWIPEKIRGKPVNSIMHLPIQFIAK